MVFLTLRVPCVYCIPVELALLVLAIIPVLGLRLEAANLQEGLVGVLREAAVAARVPRVTVNQLLLAQAHQLSSPGTQASHRT